MASKPKTQSQKVSDLIVCDVAVVDTDPNTQTRQEIIKDIRATGRIFSEAQAQRHLNRLIASGKVIEVRVARKNIRGVVRPVVGYRVVMGDK